MFDTSSNQERLEILRGILVAEGFDTRADIIAETQDRIKRLEALVKDLLEEK